MSDRTQVTPPIHQLWHALRERPFLGSIEIQEDYNDMEEYEEYLSLPVAYQRAVEVEYGEQQGAKFYAVYHRAWDQTGGLSLDEEVFTVNAQHIQAAALLIEFFVKHLVKEEDRLDDGFRELELEAERKFDREQSDTP